MRSTPLSLLPREGRVFWRGSAGGVLGAIDWRSSCRLELPRTWIGLGLGLGLGIGLGLGLGIGLGIGLGMGLRIGLGSPHARRRG